MGKFVEVSSYEDEALCSDISKDAGHLEQMPTNNAKSDFIKSIELLEKEHLNGNCNAQQESIEKSGFERLADFAEKYGATITAVSTPFTVVTGAFNDVVAKTDMPVGCVDEALSSDTLEDILATMGYTIEELGNDEDAAIKSLEDIKSDIEEHMDVSIQNNNRPTTSQPK